MSSLSERRLNELLTIAGDRLFIVGSVQQSVLNEAQFQAEAGDEWVRMDGRDITGSRLAQITGWTNLPDASGRFLRSSGGNADPNLGGTQGEGTAVNGLVLSGSSPSLNANSFAAASHSHSAGNLHARITDFGTAAIIRQSTNLSTPWSTSKALGTNSNQVSSTNSFSATPVGGSTDGSSNTNVNISGGTYSLSSSDIETRPVNLTVNTFIKIN